MSELEDLLRRTFTDRERDLDGATPSLAGVRDRARRRHRRHAAALAAAAAVVAVLAGGTVALTGGPRPAATGTPPTGTPPTGAPATAPGELPTYREAEVTSADGRTSAAIPWAPTWLPATAGETGRLSGHGAQQRLYGRGRPGPLVKIALREPLVSAPASTPECSGTPAEADGAPARALVVAGRPARLWRTRRAPTLGEWPRDPVPAAAPGHLLCVPLTGGGSLTVAVTGTADTAGDAVRVAASVRAADPVEVAAPASFGVPSYGVWVRADDAGTGRWTAGLTVPGGTVVQLGPPAATDPAPNTTVGGRPAYFRYTKTTGAALTIPVRPDLTVRMIGEFRDDTLAAGAGLQVGPNPDYGWFYR
jgi:hypothetical protein